METPWGDIVVRDSHVHFFSHQFFSLLTGSKDVASVTTQLNWDQPPVQPEELAERWVAELDRHGVTSASIMASIPGDQDSVARAVDLFPERLHGQFMFNPVAEDAAERLKSGFASGMRTVCLFPAMHHFSPGDKRLDALWPLCAGRNVFVHCGVLSVGVRRKLGLPSPYDMRYANPLDIHSVALRNPDVRFIVPHFGAGFLREALMLADLCPNVYLDTSSSNNWMKYDGGSLTLEEVFRRALNIAGPSRLLFGSDSSFFPRGWNAAIFAQQSEVLAALGVSRPNAAAILGENLLSLQQ